MIGGKRGGAAAVALAVLGGAAALWLRSEEWAAGRGAGREQSRDLGTSPGSTRDVPSLEAAVPVSTPDAGRVTSVGRGVPGEERLVRLPPRHPGTAGSFVLVMLIDEGVPGPDANEGVSDIQAHEEPSDAESDHPGGYWTERGYAAPGEVLRVLQIDAVRVWSDVSTGEILAETHDADGVERMFLISPTRTPGDADLDGVATGADVVRFLSEFSPSNADSDWNGDGETDGRDVAAFLTEWSNGAS